MSPLQERLAELRAKVRQLLWVYGMSWLTAVLLGTLLIVGTTDWWLHLDDAGVRLILGLGILGASGYVAYSRLISPLNVPLTDIDLALRIERRFPKFRDSLASTIQFLEANRDPSLGAPEMQQRVIDKTLKQARNLDFEEVVQTQPVQRVAWTAVVVFLTTALVVGFNQAEAATAIKRLVFPFGSHPWPRQTHLQFVNDKLEPLVANPQEPLRVARGDTLELTAVNLNNQQKLPAIVQLELKHADGSITREPMQRTSIRIKNDETREAAFVSLVIKSPFQFRAVGGDDQTMEWFPLEVVPPPVAEALQVRLVPPKYSRRPAFKLPPGVGHVEGLVGTRVEISAKSNKPLSSAILKIRDRDQKPVTVGPDGLKLSASFEIKEAGIYSYWIDLRDQQNFGNSDAPRYEIRAIQDSPPDIYIDRPATDIQVTANAEIPLRFVSKDDLGLKLVRMRHQLLEPDKSDLSKPVEKNLSTLDARPLQQTQEHTWQLEPLKLAVGTQIQLHGEAIDDFDLGPPHIGRSLTRTLTVVSAEEKTRELADRQIGLLNDLERTKKQETEIQTQTSELRTQLEKAGTLRPQDLDLLQRLEGQQRQLSAAVQNPQDGMLTRSKEMLHEFRQNQLNSPETEHRLGQISNELQRLADEHLSEIEQNLTQARKQSGGDTDMGNRNRPSTAPSKSRPDTPQPAPSTATPQSGTPETETTEPADTPSEGTQPTEKSPTEKPPPENAALEKMPPEKAPGGKTPTAKTPAGETATEHAPSEKTPAEKSPAERSPEPPRPGASPTEQSLHQAEQHQQAVADTLGDLLQELSQWQDERQAVIDLQEVRQAQEKINKETAELGQKTVTKSLQELKPQEQADLAREADRQQHEAEQLDQLQRRIGEIVKKLESEDASAAGRMQDILEQLQQNNTAGKMREAARQVGENNIGEAAQKQQQVATELQALEDALKNRPNSDLETLVKQMKQTEQELQDLFEQQQELLQKTTEAQQQADPQAKAEQLEQLKKEQQALQKKAEQLGRKLQRLQLKDARDAANRAAERMEQAQGALDEQPENAQAEEQEALDDIEQAQRELAQERQQAEEQLAFEQLEKVASEIQLVFERQQGVLAETRRLEAEHAARGNWTRPQLKSLRDLAETQRGVRQDTNSLIEKLSAAEVFALAVKGAARQMEQAAKRLDERQTDAETQGFEQAAIQRFQDLIDALKEEKKQKPGEEEEQPGGNSGEEQAAQRPVDQVAMLAQLKMLRALQVELNNHLLTLAAKRDSGSPLREAELEDLKLMGEEQGELAELAAKFMQMFEAKAEDQPMESTATEDKK